jgi:hypothetical protein
MLTVPVRRTNDRMRADTSRIDALSIFLNILVPDILISPLKHYPSKLKAFDLTV